MLQLDARSLKSAQRRELSSEKEYKLLEDVSVSSMAAVLKSFTMEEGFEFEAWMPATQASSKPPKGSSSSTAAASAAAAANAAAGGGKPVPISALTTTTHVHLLFSKKLTKGELTLLDRLQNHM